MRMVDVIEKKRNGEELTTEEIRFFVNGYTDGSIPDYQVSALCMAIVLNGMESREISDLTLAMMHSGDVMNLEAIAGIKVDKHSTGGVGDKTSLALLPMVSACGVKVAKMSGRGLGHTGGTLDKLESIDGFDIYLDDEEFVKQVNDINIAIIGQTAQSRWEQIAKGSIINTLLRDIPFVDIHIVSVARALRDDPDGLYEKGVRAYLEKEGSQYRLTFEHTKESEYEGIFFKEIGTDFNTGIFKFMKNKKTLQVTVTEDYVKESI